MLVPGTGPSLAVGPASDEAARAWVAVRDTTSQAVLDDFIRRYDESIYGTLARARLEELKKSHVALVVPPVVPAVPPDTGPKPAVGIHPLAPSAHHAAAAQKVVLYEEDPADPNGKRFVGSAIWRTETVTPGPGQPPDLAIRADVEVPERKLTMTWLLRATPTRGCRRPTPSRSCSSCRRTFRPAASPTCPAS